MCWWNKCRRGLCAGLIFITLSCQNSESNHEFQTDLISTSRFVDSFFMDNDSIRSVIKTLTVNEGIPEMREIEGYNIYEDLKMVKDFDVATPRWADFFEVMKTESGGVEKLEYNTQNEKAPAGNLIFLRDDDTIKSISIRSRKGTMISEQNTDIDWTPGEGYVLRSQSKLLFQKPRIFEMEVRYGNVK